LALAEEGANILVCDLGVATDGPERTKPCDSTAEECRRLGVKAVAHYGDVSSFKAPKTWSGPASITSIE